MKKVHKFSSLILACIVLFALTNCDNSFLDISQRGVLTEDNLSTAENIDGFVIAAYAWPNKQIFSSTLHPCYYGCERSDDSYKGGGNLGSQIDLLQMETFTLCTPTGANFNGTWEGAFKGIGRVNTALQRLRDISEEEFPLKEQRIAEMRFLRGYEYFYMKIYFRYVPYIDEYLPKDEYIKVGNRDLNDLELWGKIYNDFEAAYNVLPETQAEVGRPTKYAAEAFMVITLLWMACEMDEENQIVNINQSRLNEALTHCNNIIESSKYDLCSDFAHNFLCEYDNNTPESIWELQCTIDDGTNGMSLNRALTLNTPNWQPYYRCCGFHKMSYNYANACRTGYDGLPLFDTFNNAELKQENWEAYFSENTFDPRFSHTAAIPNRPWKYNTTSMPLFPFIGYEDMEGFLHSMKEQIDPTGPCQWTNRFNSMNVKVIRYSEVLLWKAEILIRLGREDEALPIINQFRQRAASSTDLLKFADGTPQLNYRIEPYTDGVNCVWTSDFAWKALIWECRMEFAGEGKRFFDLVRFGVVDEVMNAYLNKEKTRLSWMDEAFFTSGRDEFLPIPQKAIIWSKGKYVQNVGY